MRSDTMPQFIYRLHPTRIGMLAEGPTEHEAAVVGAHFAYLQSLQSAGSLLMAGRTTTDDERTFGIAIFEAESEEAAERVMREDPAVREGVMSAELLPFRVALGPPAGSQGGGSILEAAALHVKAGEAEAFESAFARAQSIIASMAGYRSHELQRCLEREGHYLLLVRWDSVEAHEQGFRKSPAYQEWKRLLHHFYDPFPTVLHYQRVASGPAEAKPA